MSTAPKKDIIRELAESLALDAYTSNDQHTTHAEAAAYFTQLMEPDEAAWDELTSWHPLDNLSREEYSSVLEDLADHIERQVRALINTGEDHE